MFSTEESLSPSEALSASFNSRRAKRSNDDAADTAGDRPERDELSFEFGEHAVGDPDFQLNLSDVSSCSHASDEKLPAVPEIRRRDASGFDSHLEHDAEELTVLEITGILPTDEDLSTEGYPFSFLSNSSLNSDNKASPSCSPAGRSPVNAVSAQLIDANEECQGENGRVGNSGITSLAVDDEGTRESLHGSSSTCWTKRKAVRLLLLATILLIISAATIPTVILLTNRNDNSESNDTSPMHSPSTAPSVRPQPPVYTLPPVMAPTSSSGSGLSDSAKMTIIAIITIAVGSASLVGLFIYCRQRKQTQANG